eukprot:2377725-Prymnesium_polylepis.1
MEPRPRDDVRRVLGQPRDALDEVFVLVLRALELQAGVRRGRVELPVEPDALGHEPQPLAL